MAIYVFSCECGYREDKMMLMADRNNPQECPKCKKEMARHIGNPGLAFHGKGFYTTDVLHPKTLRKQVLKEKKQRENGGL